MRFWDWVTLRFFEERNRRPTKKNAIAAIKSLFPGVSVFHFFLAQKIPKILVNPRRIAIPRAKFRCRD